MQMRKAAVFFIIIASVMTNLITGMNHSWSVFESTLTEQMAWSHFHAALPSSGFQVAYALSAIAGGMLIDRIGPKILGIIAAALVGGGYLLSGFADTPALLVLAYGCLAGSGAAIAYGCAVSTPLKWLPKRHHGKVSGLAVSAFALTPVFLTPFAGHLIRNFGLKKAFFTISLIFFLVLFISALFFRLPGNVRQSPAHSSSAGSFHALISSAAFLKFIVLYFSATFINIILTSQMMNISYVQTGIRDAVILVIALSVSNFLTRLITGFAADYCPRNLLLALVFAVNVPNFLFFRYYRTIPLMILGCILVGIAFGGCMTVCTPLISDFFGLENFGRNLGLLSVSTSIGGVCGSAVSGLVVDLYGNYNLIFLFAALSALIAAFCAFSLKKPD